MLFCEISSECIFLRSFILESPNVSSNLKLIILVLHFENSYSSIWGGGFFVIRCVELFFLLQPFGDYLGYHITKSNKQNIRCYCPSSLLHLKCQQCYFFPPLSLSLFGFKFSTRSLSRRKLLSQSFFFFSQINLTLEETTYLYDTNIKDFPAY